MVDVKGIVANLPPAGMNENTKLMIYGGLILAILVAIIYFFFLKPKSEEKTNG